MLFTTKDKHTTRTCCNKMFQIIYNQSLRRRNIVNVEYWFRWGRWSFDCFSLPFFMILEHLWCPNFGWEHLFYLRSYWAGPLDVGPHKLMGRNFKQWTWPLGLIGLKLMNWAHGLNDVVDCWATPPEWHICLILIHYYSKWCIYAMHQIMQNSNFVVWLVW